MMLWIPFAHPMSARPTMEGKGREARVVVKEPIPMIALHLVQADAGVVAEHPMCTERKAKRLPVERSAPGFQLVCTVCLAMSLTQMERRP